MSDILKSENEKSIKKNMLRALHSSNPQKHRNPLIFFEKWLLTHVLVGQEVKNPLASKLASAFLIF